MYSYDSYPKYEYLVTAVSYCGAESTFARSYRLDDIRSCIREYKNRYNLNVYRIDYDDNRNVESKVLIREVRA